MLDFLFQSPPQFSQSFQIDSVWLHPDEPVGVIECQLQSAGASPQFQPFGPVFGIVGSQQHQRFEAAQHIRVCACVFCQTQQIERHPFGNLTRCLTLLKLRQAGKSGSRNQSLDIRRRQPPALLEGINQLNRKRWIIRLITVLGATPSPDNVQPALVHFFAYSNATYTVEYRKKVDSIWKKVGDVPALPSNRLVSVPDQGATNSASSLTNTVSDRYYRVVAPATN